MTAPVKMPGRTVKALTLWQPWATLMAHGHKQIETRSWYTKYRGPLVIHAARRWEGDQAKLCTGPYFGAALAELGVTEPAGGWLNRPALPFGALVAVVNLVGCYPTSAIYYDEYHRGPPAAVSADRVAVGRAELAFGDYGPGRWAWLTDHLERFAEPIPMAGRQQLFDVVVPPDGFGAEDTH